MRVAPGRQAAEKPAASTNTLGRFETEVLTQEGHGSLPTVFLAGEHSRAAQCACAGGDARFCPEESCVKEALTASFTCCETTQLVLYGLSTERLRKRLRRGIGPGYVPLLPAWPALAIVENFRLAFERVCYDGR
jgi:hypothetical protein